MPFEGTALELRDHHLPKLAPRSQLLSWMVTQ